MFTFLSKKLFTKGTRSSNHFIFCMLNILIVLSGGRSSIGFGYNKYSVTSYASVTKTGVLFCSTIPK